MKLLVVKDQQDLTLYLRAQLEQRSENITIVPTSWDAIGETVDLSSLVELQQPDYLIFAVSLPPQPSKSECKKFKAALDQVERCSRKHGLPLIMISSGDVFDGAKLSYREDDELSPATERGKCYADAEQQLIKKLRKHLILRTTWQYSSQGSNFLTDVISYAAADRLISVNSAGKSCPTSMNDLARVLIAVLLQLDLGADAWGVYHYVSSDTSLGFQFVEAVLAQASQFNADINPQELKFEHNESPLGRFYYETVILKCQKLLDNFGIHQKPWRSSMPASVKEYFEEVSAEAEVNE